MIYLQERFFAAAGRRIRVTIAPRERRDGPGLDPDLRTIIFEVEGGEWIGAVPILASYPLALLTSEEIRHYFKRARSPEGRRS